MLIFFLCLRLAISFLYWSVDGLLVYIDWRLWKLLYLNLDFWFSKSGHLWKLRSDYWWILISKINSVPVLPLFHEWVSGTTSLKIEVTSYIIFFLYFSYFLDSIISLVSCFETKFNPVVPFMQMHSDGRIFILLLSKNLSHLFWRNFKLLVVINNQIQIQQRQRTVMRTIPYWVRRPSYKIHILARHYNITKLYI